MADRQSSVERVRDSKVGGMCYQERSLKGKRFISNIGYNSIKCLFYINILY